MSDENLKIVVTGDASGVEKASAQAIAAIARISAAAEALEAKLANIGDVNIGSGGVSQVAKSVEVLETSLGSLGATASRVSVVMPSVMADRGETITVGAKAVDTLNESLAGLGATASKVSVIMPSVMADRGQTITVGAKAVDALNNSISSVGATVSRVSSEWDTFAKAPFVSLTAQAQAFDDRARRLNQTMNYTNRGFSTLGSTVKEVAPNIKSVSTGFAGVGGSAIRAQYALSGIERAFRGNGIQGYVFGLQQTAREFGNMVAASGSVKGAFASLGSVLAGPAGIIFGASFLVEILSKVIQKYGSLGNAIQALLGNVNALAEAQKEYDTALAAAEKPVSNQIAKLKQLQSDFDLASKGIVSQKNALTEYNSTLGTSFGKLSSFSEAQKKINEISPDFIRYTLMKGVAENLLAQYADKAAKALTDANKPQEQFVSTWAQFFIGFQKFANFPITYTKQALGFQSNNKYADQYFHTLGNLSFVLGSVAKYNALGKDDKEAQQTSDIFEQWNKRVQELGKSLKITFGGSGGSGTKGIKTIEGIAKSLSDEFETINAKTKIYGLTIEEIGAMKMAALTKSIDELATIHTPAAIKKGQEYLDLVRQIAKESFLPTLTGGRAQVNTPGAGAAAVPTYVNPNISGPTPDPQKIAKAERQTFDPFLVKLKDLGVISDSVFTDMNQKITDNAGAANLLASSFEGIFSAIASGGNPFDALIQSIEQLIIKLAAAAAAVALLNFIPGGTAVLKVLDLGGSVPHFAQGGYIPGPQLAVVGDAPGGEWVLNQKQIGAILNGSGGAGGNVRVSGEFKISGNDLVASVNSTNKRNGRIN